MVAELPPGQIHAFRDLMMPALVRVGAITPRSRELYAAAGIPVWETRRCSSRWRVGHGGGRRRNDRAPGP